MTSLKPNTKPAIGVEQVANGFFVNVYHCKEVCTGLGAMIGRAEERVEIETFVFATLAEVVVFLATHFNVPFNSDKALGVN